MTTATAVLEEVAPETVASTTVSSRPAVDPLSVLAQSSTDGLLRAYRRLGYDVEQTDRGRIVMRTGTVTAVQMPPELAASVQKLLDEQQLRMPIIGNLGTGWRTFLAGPAPDGPVHLQPELAAHLGAPEPVLLPRAEARLFRLAVIRTVGGAELTLPGIGSLVEWHCAPESGQVQVEYAALLELTIAAARLDRRTAEGVG